MIYPKKLKVLIVIACLSQLQASAQKAPQLGKNSLD